MELNKNHILGLEPGEKIVQDSNNELQLDTELANEYISKKMDRDSGVFRNNQPDTIVIHYTGSKSKKSAINALFKSKSQVSAHFVIDTDGTVIQLMPLNKIGWHAGVSKMNDRSGINKYSIGIEIVNPGYLKKGSGNTFLTAYNEVIPAEKAVEAKHKNESKPRYWHTYSPEQIEAVNYLCLELSEMLSLRYIVGHDDISPGRKVDPGPLYPLEKLKENVLNSCKYDEIQEGTETPKFGHVKVDKLNIRENGDSASQKIALPLTQGSKVEILEKRDDWYKVKTEIVGWVSAKYIDS